MITLCCVVTQHCLANGSYDDWRPPHAVQENWQIIVPGVLYFLIFGGMAGEGVRVWVVACDAFRDSSLFDAVCATTVSMGLFAVINFLGVVWFFHHTSQDAKFEPTAV